MEPPPARAGGGAPRLRPPTRAAHSTHARPPTQAVVRCLLAKGRQPLAELLRNSQLERPLLKQVLMALIHQNMVWAWLQPEEVLIDRVVPAVYLYEADLAAILQDLRWGGGERRRSGRAGGRAGGRVGASTSTHPPTPHWWQCARVLPGWQRGCCHTRSATPTAWQPPTGCCAAPPPARPQEAQVPGHCGHGDAAGAAAQGGPVHHPAAAGEWAPDVSCPARTQGGGHPDLQPAPQSPASERRPTAPGDAPHPHADARCLS